MTLWIRSSSRLIWFRLAISRLSSRLISFSSCSLSMFTLRIHYTFQILDGSYQPEPTDQFAASQTGRPDHSVSLFGNHPGDIQDCQIVQVVEDVFH